MSSRSSRFVWKSKDVVIRAPYVVLKYAMDILKLLKHQPLRHDQKKHDPTKGAASREIPDSSDALALAADMEDIGIDRLKSGNCWVFASAMYEKLRDAGEKPVILDWSGHVDAAIEVDGKYNIYTPDGVVSLQEHWMSRVKPNIWRVHSDPNALIRFVDQDYPLISPSNKVKLMDNFRRAEQLVGANWKIPEEEE